MSFVQAKSNGVGAAVFATSIAVTLGAAVGTGNLVGGGVTWGGPNGGSAATTDLSSVTDDKGNTYTIVRRILNAGDNQASASFYGKNITGGPTIITANFSTSAETRGISVQEHSGQDTSAPLDGTNEQGQTQATPGTGTDGAKSGSGTQTPSVNNCTVIAFSVNTGALNSAGGSEFAAGTNFTEPANAEWSVANDISFSSEYWIQTTATAVNAAFTVTQNVGHITFQMVFKAAAGGGGTIVTKSADDAIVVADSNDRIVTRGRVAEDLLTISEGNLEKYVIYNLLAEDTLTLVDEAIRVYSRTRSGDDFITIVDDLLSSTTATRIVTSIISSLLSITDEVQTSILRGRVADDPLTIVDDALVSRLRQALAEDSITIVDDSIGYLLRNRNAESDIFLADDAGKTMMRTIVADDFISIFDSAIRSIISGGGATPVFHPMLIGSQNLLFIGSDSPNIVLGSGDV